MAEEHGQVHILLPTTKSNVNLCKTLLTMIILGYPTPWLIAWGAGDADTALMGGGTHYTKIRSTLEYLNDEKRRAKPGFEDELVFMLDSYDIWFQLPIDILLSRYKTILREENERVAHRMGKAYNREQVHTSVIFGGGKRCSPNEIHTVACYPIPESPLPKDTHQGNTNTALGRNLHTSFNTRYLNSGYMIGPVKDVRPLLTRAQEKLEDCIDRTRVWFDNGSGDADRCYHGSDQSIFVEMMGEQEFHREVMRRHHRGFMDPVLDKIIADRSGADLEPTQIMGVPISDRLNPAVTHEYHDPTYIPGKPFEFGIGIDYWSALGHQTSNAEFDLRYIRHDKPIEPQVGYQGMFDCPAKTLMAEDLPSGPLTHLKDEPNRWETMPLYTEICIGAIPVMIHHNSIDKRQRETQWDRTWWHGRSRALLEMQRSRGAPQLTQGIPTGSGEWLTWEELCPRSVEPELFRDVTKAEVEAELMKGLGAATDTALGAARKRSLISRHSH